MTDNNETQRKIEVMQGALDGKRVLIRSNGPGGRWAPVLNAPSNLNWDWAHFDYKLAPEPEILYLPDHPSYNYTKACTAFKSESEARSELSLRVSQKAGEDVKIRKFVEVFD